MNSLLYTLLILSLKGVFMEHEKTISLSPNDRHRQLFFLTKATVALESPDNGTVVATNSMQVDVSYGTSSFLAFLKLFSRVEVLLDTKVVATKGSVFLGLPFPSGQHSFVVDVSSIDDGTHELQAKAYLGFGLLGRTSESEVAIVTIDRTPLLVKTFKELSFIEGYMNDSDESVENYEGVDYDVRANVTISKDGIVSLSRAQSLIDLLDCSENGFVSISFFEEVDETFLNVMFPIGSILVIDGSVFGSCFLGIDSEDNVTSYYTDTFVNSTEDGYLIITDIIVGRRKNDVQIFGNRTSYMFLFEEADFDIFPVGFDIDETNRTERGMQTAYVSTFKKFSVNKDSIYPRNASPILRSNVKGLLQLLIGTGYRLKWKNRINIDAKIFLDYKLSFDSSVGLAFQDGEDNNDDEVEDFIFSFPLLEAPKIKVLTRLKIPSPKTGLYIDLSSYLKADVTSSVSASVTSGAQIGTGGKRLTFSLKGNLWDLKLGFSTVQSKAPTIANSVTVTSNFPSGSAAVVNARAGIQPGLWLYVLGIVRVGVYQRSLMAFNVRGLDPDALPPRNNRIAIGPCSTCHRFETAGDLLVTNLKWRADFFGFTIPISIPFLGTIERRVYGKKSVGGDIIKGDVRLDGFLLCKGSATSFENCTSECCNPSTSYCSELEGRCRIAD